MRFARASDIGDKQRSRRSRMVRAMMPLVFIRPGLVLHVWQDGRPMVQVTLTRRHALSLLRDLATALAENDDQP